MGTRTRVRVDTHTQSVTQVVAGVLDVFRSFVEHLGLHSDHLDLVAEVLEGGLRTWLSGHFLTRVYLEVYTRDGTLVTRVDLEMDYRTAVPGDVSFVLDLFLAKLMAQKVGRVAGTCMYRVVADVTDDAPAVPGWSGTRLLSTAGFAPWSIGEALNSPDIGAKMQLWLR